MTWRLVLVILTMFGGAILVNFTDKYLGTNLEALGVPENAVIAHKVVHILWGAATALALYPFLKK